MPSCGGSIETSEDSLLWGAGREDTVLVRHEDKLSRRAGNVCATGGAVSFEAMADGRSKIQRWEIFWMRLSTRDDTCHVHPVGIVIVRGHPVLPLTHCPLVLRGTLQHFDILTASCLIVRLHFSCLQQQAPWLKLSSHHLQNQNKTPKTHEVVNSRTSTMRYTDRTSLLISALLSIPSLSAAFYLPGVAPSSYDEGQSVPLHVNHLTPGLSRDEQLHSVFSYDYYHPAFHFCQPEGGSEDVRESLGSILFGDRIQSSPIELHMVQNETCKPICGQVEFDSRSAKFTNRRIAQGYNINWLVDGLPAAQLNYDPATKTKYYNPGFALGDLAEDGQSLLNNHFEIVIDYHRVGHGHQDKFRVVGVLVQPESRRDSRALEDGTAECGTPGNVLTLNEDGETPVTWTYSVHWKESPTVWATRWDKYLHVHDPKIHWFSLVNSAVFVVFLVGMVIMILVRALRKDIARYNRLDSINLEDLDGTSAAVEDGIQEDSGWKLVHGDVFRCPKSPLLLSVMLGNGAQLFMMTGVTIGRSSFWPGARYPLLTFPQRLHFLDSFLPPTEDFWRQRSY